MPAKRRVDEDEESSSSSATEDDDDDASEFSDDDSEDDSDEEPHRKAPVTHVPKKTPESRKAPPPPPPPPAGGNMISNNPHDEEFAPEDDERIRTPPNKTKPPQAAPAPRASNAQAGGSTALQNDPNDEFVTVDDHHVKTPPGNNVRPSAAPVAQNSNTTSGAGFLKNDAYDEFQDVEDDGEDDDDESLDTPPPSAKPAPAHQQQRPANQTQLSPGGSQVIKNQPHDESVDVADDSPVKSPEPASSTKSASTKAQPVPAKGAKLAAMSPGEDSEESTSEEEEGSAPRMQGNVELPKAAAAASTADIEYNAADYAYLNAKVSREVRELFAHITSFQPTTMELPAKLRPFVPEFIPAVGDIDTFCKIPRPDSKPDNFGLVVVDEPASNQSNPAVVKIGLQYMSKQQSSATFVDSVDDAQHKPQVIDKWIADIKQLHIKKPLPTVTYSKPMPDIESLLQVWPQEFEDMLSSDITLPPPQIDLDIYQYVRVLCAILDIPTYGNVIESLHVMFTLYLEFRANQHFQHA